MPSFSYAPGAVGTEGGATTAEGSSRVLRKKGHWGSILGSLSRTVHGQAFTHCAISEENDLRS